MYSGPNGDRESLIPESDQPIPQDMIGAAGSARGGPKRGIAAEMSPTSAEAGHRLSIDSACVC